MGLVNDVFMQLPARAGAIYPPNALSNELDITYESAIRFTLSDGLVHGSITTLLRVTATATFFTAVTGVQASDFVVTNAIRENFRVVSPTVRARQHAAS